MAGKGQAGHGMARIHIHSHLRRGEARHGVAWWGAVRQGLARHGSPFYKDKI